MTDDVVYPVVTPAEQERFLRLQAFEDAIAYRTARLAAPCPACRTAPCDEHAVDADLIAAYRRAAAQCAEVPAPPDDSRDHA